MANRAEHCTRRAAQSILPVDSPSGKSEKWSTAVYQRAEGGADAQRAIRRDTACETAGLKEELHRPWRSRGATSAGRTMRSALGKPCRAIRPDLNERSGKTNETGVKPLAAGQGQGRSREVIGHGTPSQSPMGDIEDARRGERRGARRIEVREDALEGLADSRCVRQPNQSVPELQ